MSKINMYWSVYKNLERDTLSLANYLLFTDAQLSVYSIYIADLIVRCAIEIEAISKDLYLNNGGTYPLLDENGDERDMYFDTDCLKFLEDKWIISEKKIIVAATTFYFENEENKILCPLKKSYKRGTSGSKWKQAYQAVKHDRQNSIQKASVEHLIQAMGALYILNLYYKSESFDLPLNEKFDASQGSEMFEAFTVNATLCSLSDKIVDTHINDYDKVSNAIFVQRYKESAIKDIEQAMIDDHNSLLQFCRDSTIVQEHIQKNPSKTYNNLTHLLLDAGGVELVSRSRPMMKIQKILPTLSKEIICNKGGFIYASP